MTVRYGTGLYIILAIFNTDKLLVLIWNLLEKYAVQVNTSWYIQEYKINIK